MKYILLIVTLLFCLKTNGQDTSVIFGLVNDLDTGAPVEFATVYIKGTTNSSETDSEGGFRLEVNSGEKHTIVVNRVGYHEAERSIKSMPSGGKRYIKVKLASQETDIGIVIRDSRIEDIGMVREEVTDLIKLPTASGNFESVLPNIALGTSSGTGGELSSQYNVRGGNYDENLVYVNDFEIFRPQLIRSSQQEGLTFPNIDLIRDLSFSSGGFESKYGDKMSSVLDVRYKRPEEFKGSASASLLGASAHIEGSKKLGANAYNKFRYLVGARYKTTTYLLGSLDIEGEYVPSFTDVQGYFTYDITNELQIGVLGNYNNSVYNYVPLSRTTTTGLINQTIQFAVAYEGSEKDGFTNGMGGMSLTYIPQKAKHPLYLKLLSSVYSNLEQETFDILGYYRLSQIETDLGGNGEGEEIGVLGLGLQHGFARNYLYNRIVNVQHKGGLEIQSKNERYRNFIQWGIKAQEELIEDELNEWERLDSAGYSLPFNQDEVLLNEVFKSVNNLTSMRYSAFAQNTYSIDKSDKYELSINAGVRATYWSLNKEFNISPRGQLLFRPAKSKSNISYKLAGGIYYQPPFYREMRRENGEVNTDLLAQKSTHVIVGIQKDLNWTKISKKPFKLITEFYYKKLENLVSYEVDNVRIRYSGDNDASGYVWGWDFRVNGEFVPDAESWVNVSLLNVRESIDGITHLQREVGDTIATEVKYVPRPTDQLLNVSIFFQDYLPKNENFKMQLNMSFGTGLPFGIKDNNLIFRNTYRFKPYYRADIGFSYMLWNAKKRTTKPKHFLRFTEQSWISFEVFNMMNVQNVASNTWVKTIGSQFYAIPNFLTSRRINVKFRIDF